MNFEQARDQFPVFERYAYLNAGTNGPLARATVEAMAKWNSRDLEQGRSGKPYFEQILALRELAREALADVLEVPPGSVALVSSTTNACNVVLLGLGLAAEDEVVTTDVEHFGLLGPLLASPAKVRVAHVRDAPPAEAPRLICDQITSRTKLVAVSHVSWMTGNSLAPAELRRQTEVPILLDGAQSAGACRTHAGEFDFYTASGQKWLCGPDSTGALYVRDPERLRVALPTYMSQSAYDVEESFTPKPGAPRFDSVWYAPGTLAGLLAALETAPDWRYERRSGDGLAEGLLRLVDQRGGRRAVAERPLKRPRQGRPRLSEGRAHARSAGAPRSRRQCDRSARRPAARRPRRRRRD